MTQPFCMHVLCLCMKCMHEKGWSIIQAFAVPYDLNINLKPAMVLLFFFHFNSIFNYFLFQY